MVSVTTTVDFSGAFREITNLEKAVLPQAATAALNRVAASARTQAVRVIGAESSLKQADVRPHVTLTKATRTRLEAVINAQPWSPNLIRYQARQVKAGVSARAWGQRKVYKGAFIGNKGRTVFKRATKERLPLKALHGPSVPKEFVATKTRSAMDAKIKERFVPEFESALRQFLRTRRGR
jgi:hypothetical protein